MIWKVREKSAITRKELRDDMKAVTQITISTELHCTHLHSYTPYETPLLKKKQTYASKNI